MIDDADNRTVDRKLIIIQAIMLNESLKRPQVAAVNH